MGHHGGQMLCVAAECWLGETGHWSWPRTAMRRCSGRCCAAAPLRMPDSGGWQGLGWGRLVRRGSVSRQRVVMSTLGAYSPRRDHCTPARQVIAATVVATAPEASATSYTPRTEGQHGAQPVHDLLKSGALGGVALPAVLQAGAMKYLHRCKLVAGVLSTPPQLPAAAECPSGKPVACLREPPASVPCVWPLRPM